MAAGRATNTGRRREGRVADARLRYWQSLDTRRAMTQAEIRTAVKNWPYDKRITFEERAAIMEFDGGLSRERAEKLAYARLK
jgi:hypothetical protein